ncbi:hypothetical protein KIN20_008288 [Parelaphostrongylus tenuis]|uniref:Uncharacterized protein n=1 Tax=Parelaphostrongylus tenuis TaxID=148309 RepID=A0AAD5M4M4_PARTN|nr:hypothetical protein KIN20_008288 [Parelaphostrongylus tenuis]
MVYKSQKDYVSLVHLLGCSEEEAGLEVEEEEVKLPNVEKTFVPITQSTITTIQSPFAFHGAVEGAQVSPEDADRAADDRDANRLAGVQEEVEEDCVLAESAAKSVAEDARDEGFQGEALWANSQRLDSGNFLMSSLTNSYLTLLVYTINKFCLNSFLK